MPVDPWLRRKDEPLKHRTQVTKDDIILGLKRLDLELGDTMFVHSSFSSFGYVLGGPDTIIDALLEIVGCQGTLIFPTFTWQERTEALLLGLKEVPEGKSIAIANMRDLMRGRSEVVDSHLARGLISTGWVEQQIKELNLIESEEETAEGKRYYVNLNRVQDLLKIKPKPWPSHFLFNKNTTPSCTGIISETFRLRKGVIRSDHPRHSIAAFGPKAKLFTDPPGNPLTSAVYDAWGPKLYECDVKYLLLGIDYRYCTMFHLVEYRFKELEKDYPHPRFDFLKIGDALEEEGLVRSEKIGEATCRLLRCKQMVDLALKIIRENPKAFLKET